LNAQQTPYIVCFGEVLWDVYPEGKKLGGAPFNVAAHATQLGLKAQMISRVGKDALGEEIIKAIKSQGISPGYTVVDKHHDTGVVDVLLDQQGKPTYNIKQPAAWDFIVANRDNITLVQEAEAFVFGSLACRSATSRNSLFELAKLSRRNICDLNIRLNYYNEDLITALLQITNILKINDEEAHLLQSLYGLPEENFYEALSQKFDLDLIIQTLGANGAEAYHNGKVIRCPGVKIDVVDTVGSGDSFLAAFIRQFLAGEDLESCLRFATATGALIATRRGAIPEINEQEVRVMMNYEG
jgi:fructokinase